MPRHQPDLEKVTVRLSKGSSAKLSELFPKAGYNWAIRSLVDAFLKKVDAQEQDIIQEIQVDFTSNNSPGRDSPTDSRGDPIYD